MCRGIIIDAIHGTTIRAGDQMSVRVDGDDVPKRRLRQQPRADVTHVALPAGLYVVTAEQTGFKIAALSDVQLTVDQIQRVDLI